MENPNRTGISFTVTFDDWRRLKRESAERRMSVSEFIREKLGCKRLKRMQIDERLAKGFARRIKLQQSKMSPV